MENLSGQTVKGYALRERIGSGGFGAVYRAHQSTVGREVAIKIILPGFASTPEFIRRFEIEAQLIARLEHLHIVPLFDYWRDPNGAYLVMRWLRGGSLRDALKNGPFDLDSSARLLDQISGALAVAHRNKVIHRDIKPGNILLDEDSNAYLADFGIAKDLTIPQEGITQPDSVVGSLDYISPEQARGEPVTPCTDIYSLGVVLYEMLEGEHPFPGSNPLERLYKHINDPLPEISRINGQVGPAVNEVIRKATAKDPTHRYADALALATAFREAALTTSLTEGESVVEKLTRREQEVLRLLVTGRTNKEIANELFIEVSTVKWYTKQIYAKLGVRSRMQAIVRARELDLVVDSEQWANGDTSTLSSIVSLPEPENPYKGLRAFEPADHRDFFGREALSKRLLERMTENSPLSRFLVVAGPSGSGKSSLVKAGLIPALWRGDLPGSERWFVVDMVPGTHPIDELEVALMRVAANQSGNIRDQLTRDERGLVRVAQLILPDDSSQLVVIIDQFEEVFTLVESETTRQQFLDLLRTAVIDPASRGVQVVITLRADFYGRPLHYPEFGELVRSRMETVLPLTAQGLEQAIISPAQRVGLTFEEGLVAQIVGEMTYQAGALPLLQYALTELFEQRNGRVLTHTVYQEIGGAVGALAKRAEEVFNEFDTDAQELTHQMFLRLVTLGEGAEDTRRRVARSELLAIASGDSTRIDDIIDTYGEYRLLTLDHDPATRSPTVEVAHEAVLREWERLREWLKESRDEIRLQRQLARMAQEWRNSDQDKSYLVRGSRLTKFETWAPETELALTSYERNYLDASITERERQADAERERRERETALKLRAQRVLQGLVGVFLIAAIISGGLAIFAFDRESQAKDAEQAARDAEHEARRQASIGLAALARAELEGVVPERAVLLALEALEQYPHTSQAESALADAVEAYVAFVDLPAGYVLRGSDSSWSHDGERLVGGSPGGTGDTDTISTYTGEPLNNIPVNMDNNCMVTDAAWSPDDDQFVTTLWTNNASQPCAPTVWDAHSGEALLTLLRHEGTYVGDEVVDWSSNGATILTAGLDGLARLSDGQTGEELLVFSGHSDAIRDADLSPSGDRAATASADGTAQIWDADTGQELLVISNHIGVVHSITWSPDGTRVATAGEDGIARVWDSDSGVLLLVYPGHTDAILGIAWSPDGDRIATVSRDQTAQVWDATTGEALTTQRTDGTAVIWSPGGDRLVVTGGKPRIWDLATQPLILSGHTDILYGAHWSPDGTRIATSGRGDHSIRIWDAATGDEQLLLEEPGPMYMGWSPDGTRIVTSNTDAVVRVWDVTTGEILMEIDAPSDMMFFLAYWSPDGSQIAASTFPIQGALTSNTFLFDPITGETLTVTESRSCLLHQPSWSPAGDRIVTGCVYPTPNAYPDGNSPAYIWDSATGEMLMALESDHGETFSVEYSPDGSRIATGHGDGTIRIWDAGTGMELRTLLGHNNQIYDLTWSPNGTRIVSGDAVGLVKVWDVESGVEALSFLEPAGIETALWSPDGSHIMVAGHFPEPVIRRAWQSTQELIDEAYECCVTRELTPEERKQFGLPPRQE